jgi:hypothetical protein
VYVRFAPESGLKSDIVRRPRSAMSRHTQRSKIHAYSIISSARTSSAVGKVSPSAANAAEAALLPKTILGNPDRNTARIIKQCCADESR